MKISIGDLTAYAVGWGIGNYIFGGKFDWAAIEFVAIAMIAEIFFEKFSNRKIKE